MERKKVLAINPGSTSTKVSIFEGEQELYSKSLSHSTEEIDKFEKIVDQFDYRKDVILDWLKEIGVSTGELRAVIGRGGLLRSMPSGIYSVTDAMIEDLKIGVQGQHASNLGGILAKTIGDMEGIGSYIVDPVAVDEFMEIAKLSGHPLIPRVRVGHALNIRAMGHKVAKNLGRDFSDLNMIVVHLGGGISVVPITGGKMIDNTNINDEGPFSPERAGGLPVGQFAKMCFSGKYTLKEMTQKIRGKGGLAGYLGTNDVRDVDARIQSGDKEAKLVLEAMAYQVAKQIGAVATSLNGKVDVIILTGGVAYCKFFTDYVEDMVSFIAPIKIEPGEDEMKALNGGFLRMVSGEDRVKIYEDEVKND